MRRDKLTPKFQQTLGDAQSIAVGQDHKFIEPLHLLAALLDQEDGGRASLLSRAGQKRRAPAVFLIEQGRKQVQGLDEFMVLPHGYALGVAESLLKLGG